MSNNNDIATVQQDITPATMIQQSLDKGVSPADMTELYNLYERENDRRARMAFNAAITLFKEDPPEIFKNKHVSFGQTNYKHATLDDIVDKVTTPLMAVGLTFRWDVDQTEQISVTCILSHTDGHSERVTMRGPSDDSGKKNKIQSVGSTATYLQRYTLLALLGLAAKDDDDAGRSAMEKNSAKITNDQVLEIEAFISENELDAAAIKQVIVAKGHKEYADLPASQFKSFMGLLKRTSEGA